MKTLLLIIVFFIGTANADVTIVIGQSNAVGIANYGNLDKLTRTKVVACTHIGSIQKFMPKGQLYRQCIKAVAGRTVANVVFWQGEADSQDYDSAIAWKKKTMYVLKHLYDDVCNKKSKLVIVAINSYVNSGWFPYWPYIRAQQYRIKGAIVIDSSNYPFEASISLPSGEVLSIPLHLTKDGYGMISLDIAKRLKKRRA